MLMLMRVLLDDKDHVLLGCVFLGYNSYHIIGTKKCGDHSFLKKWCLKYWIMSPTFTTHVWILYLLEQGEDPIYPNWRDSRIGASFEWCRPCHVAEVRNAFSKWEISYHQAFWSTLGKKCAGVGSQEVLFFHSKRLVEYSWWRCRILI